MSKQPNYTLKIILPRSTKIDELKHQINLHKLTLTSDFTTDDVVVLKKKEGYYIREKGFEVSIKPEK